MPWNGSGMFTRTHDWSADRDAGGTSAIIDADKMDAEFDNFKAGLEQCLTRDGQNNPLADLPMNGKKHTGVGNAAARNQYAVVGQVQDQSYTYVATVGGTADAVTLSPAPAVTAYAAGQAFSFIASGDNTGAVTVNVSGLGAKALTKDVATALSAGDIASGAVIRVQYDGTQFQMGTPPAVSGGTINKTFALAGDITPSQITADQNDYNPTGLSTSSVLRLSTDAARSITGLAGGSDGRLLVLHNVGSNDILLKDENSSSTAANRFALSQAEITLKPDQSIVVQYDSTSNRWRVFAANPANVGNVVTLEQYGGAAGADNTAAFNAFIAAATADNGGDWTLLLGEGAYLFNSKPNAVSQRVTIIGQGSNRSSLVRNYTPNTAVGATTDTAGYAIGVTVVNIASAGTGAISVGDWVQFDNHPMFYQVTVGDLDVSNGGSITLHKALDTAIPASATAIRVQQDFLKIEDSYQDWRGFDIGAGDGTSKGRLLSMIHRSVANGGPWYGNWSYFRDIRFVQDLLNGSAFDGICDVDIFIDGRDPESATGYRDLVFENCWCGFISQQHSLEGYSVRHMQWDGGFLTTPVAAPSQTVKIRGDVHTSDNVRMEPVAAGNLDIEDCLNCFFNGPWATVSVGSNVRGVFAGYVLTTISNGSPTKFSMLTDDQMQVKTVWATDSASAPPPGIGNSTIEAFTGNSLWPGLAVKRFNGLNRSYITHSTDGDGDHTLFSVENFAAGVDVLKLYDDEVRPLQHLNIVDGKELRHNGTRILSAGGSFGWQVTTEAVLGGIANAINTTDKFQGKPVWTSDTRKVFTCTGSSASHSWVSADGATVITPA